MKYRIEGGTAHVGADILLALTKEQVSARESVVETDGKHWRGRTVLQFKAGETLDIVTPFDALPRTLQSVLVPLEKRAKAKGEAKPDAAHGSGEGGDGADA